MVNFGAKTNIGYVLVVGYPSSTNGMNWYVTFGSSANPIENDTLYAAGANVDWAKEVQIGRSG